MLTEKQQKLYEYLLRKAVVTQHYITKEDICKDLHEYYPRYAERMSEHNSTAYHQIRNDIKAINNQPPGEYLLVASSSRGYKIADREDAEKYIQRRFKSHFRALKRTWAMRKKAGMDGQMTLGEEITELKTFLGE